jgi:hypothetical protein
MSQILTQNLKQLSNTSFVNEKSKELSENFCAKIFAKIFEMLTGGTTEKVDKFTDFTKLNEKVRNAVYPLFLELEEQNEDLNLDEFILAGKQLYGLLTTEEKGNLISWYNSTLKKNSENTNFTFKVNLSKLSQL